MISLVLSLAGFVICLCAHPSITTQYSLHSHRESEDKALPRSWLSQKKVNREGQSQESSTRNSTPKEKGWNSLSQTGQNVLEQGKPSLSSFFLKKNLRSNLRSKRRQKLIVDKVNSATETIGYPRYQQEHDSFKNQGKFSQTIEQAHSLATQIQNVESTYHVQIKRRLLQSINDSTSSADGTILLDKLPILPIQGPISGFSLNGSRDPINTISVIGQSEPFGSIELNPSNENTSITNILNIEQTKFISVLPNNKETPNGTLPPSRRLSGETTVSAPTASSGVPRVLIERSNLAFTFKIYNYSKRLNPASSIIVNLPFNYSTGVTKQTVMFSTPQTYFTIPEDTSVITIAFESTGSCLIPIFVVAHDSYPKLTVDSFANPQFFSIETDYPEGLSFVDKATYFYELYSFDQDISRVAKGRFYFQKASLEKQMQSKIAYGLVYCPFYNGTQTPFTGIVEMTQQSKNLTSDPLLLNVYEELVNPVFDFYVPYGGSHTIVMNVIPEDFLFTFNTTNVDAYFNVQYVVNDELKQTTEEADKSKDTRIIIPKSKSAKITVYNRNNINALFLEMVTTKYSSSDATPYIIIGVVVGVVVILAIIGICWWYRRHKKKKEIMRLHKDEQLMDSENGVGIAYPILSNINNDSPEERSEEDNQNISQEPFFAEEMPDSQRLMGNTFSDAYGREILNPNLQLYNLNIHEFEMPESSEGMDENIIQETKPKSKST